MQHHANGPLGGPPPLMRGPLGHQVTVHMNVNNVPQHMPAVNSMVPPPPTAPAVPYQHHQQHQKHINVSKQPAPTQQQTQLQPSQVNNKAPSQTAPSSAASGAVVPPQSNATGVLQQAQNIREHHNRLAHHQSQQPQLHRTQLMQSQMQKIRQQHQHLNNNNTNINNNSNHSNVPHRGAHQHHHHPQYNQVNAAATPHSHPQHVSATQQHRSTSHYQQQQPHRMLHSKTHQQQYQPNHNNTNILKPVAQSLQASPPGNAQPQHYYYGNGSLNNNKSKFNNNNHNATNATANSSDANFITPKTILQNPNRVSIKTRNDANASNNNSNNNNNIAASTTTTTTTSISTSVTSTGHATATGSKSEISTANNGSISTTNGSSSNAAATVATENTSDESASTHTHIAATDDAALPVNDGNSIETNKENAIVASNVNGEMASGNNSCGDILSNEDESAASKNSKEKTPMCLVNELARFNKITHQYRLTGEQGPAHCKSFTVTLKLGDEEYTAEGFKIKKAQHLAAAEAIEKTKYKHPIPKAPRRSDEGRAMRVHITPTVELNALAMKMGQQTYYLFDPKQMPPLKTDSNGTVSPNDNMTPPQTPSYCATPPPPHMMPPQLPHARMLEHQYMRRNAPHSSYGPGPMVAHAHPRYGRYPPKYQHYPMMPPPPLPPPPPGAQNNMPPPHSHARYGKSPPRPPCKITLIVGKQKFVGIGRTIQQAKHDAASSALEVLKTQATNQLNEIINNSIEESDNKSPISLVHEIAVKRNMTVHFKVLREEGPAHMKNFVTACIVGSIVTEGDGNGKKISKKRSAEKMVEELKKLPPLSPSKSPVRRIKLRPSSKSAPTTGSSSKNVGNVAGVTDRRRRQGASIKDKSLTDADDNNPITKLIQLQQTRKEREPAFELIAKNGNQNSRRREFIMEVTVQGMVARGTGGTKKLAKRSAAQNLLNAMGFESASDAKNDKTNSKLETTSKETTDVSDATLVSNKSNAIVETNTAKSVPSGSASKDLREIFETPVISTSAGPVPGILILRQNKKNVPMFKKKEIHNSVNTITEEVNAIKEESANVAKPLPTEITTSNNALGSVDAQKPTSASTTAITCNTSANESKSNSLTTGSNGTGTGNASTVTQSSSVNLHMKEQLLYLAKLLGFEVNFSDYPKGNHNEFLTIVTLSTNPPQICHGVGGSSDESQNDAAKNALKILSELGLNKLK